jgi:DNA-binding MarR family transcriptional regulator
VPKTDEVGKAGILATADALRPALLQLGRELRREARRAGVSTEQVATLVAIKYTPGITAGELAVADRVSPAAMSKLISRLERDGLIERTPSETDRRRVGLKLTADGHRILRRVRSRRTAWLATRLQELEPDEQAAIAAAVGPLSQLLHDGEGRA